MKNILKLFVMVAFLTALPVRAQDIGPRYEPNMLIAAQWESTEHDPKIL
jgi:hypothetical protein